MTDRMLMIFDVFHVDDNGTIDEFDVIAAMRRLIPELQESHAERPDGADIMIRFSNPINDLDENKRMSVLVLTPQILSELINQVNIAQGMAPLMNMPPEVLSEIAKAAIARLREETEKHSGEDN